MPQIVDCPGCGKPLWIGDSGSGLTTVCSNCKTAVEAPSASRSVRRPGAKAGGIGAMVWGAIAAGVLAVGGGVWFFLIHQSSPAPITPPESAAVSSSPATSVAPSPPVADEWETRQRAQILALKNEGDRLAANGELRPALDQYRQMRQLVGDHAINGADLHRAIAEAATAEQRVVDELLQAASAPPAAPATMAVAATTEPAPVSPASPAVAPVEPPPAAVVPNVPRARVARSVQTPPREKNDITDEEVGQSIQRGVDWLIKHMENGKLRDVPNVNTINEGMNALAVYSLLQASLAIKDDRLNAKGPLVKSMLDGLRTMRIDGRELTYAHAIRATALAVLNRPEDNKVLRTDVNWLLKAHHLGGYGYNEDPSLQDQSNSQYALLGVWAGAESGMEISQNYWQAVDKFWKGRQQSDGQWGYFADSDREGFAMDCAGTASLFITHDYLDATTVGKQLGRPPFSKELEKAIAYLEQGDHSVKLDLGSIPWFVGYNLYGLERVGLASGLKHLGTHDWYRELARPVINAQKPDGSWLDIAEAMNVGTSHHEEAIGLIDQCYVLLFLSRGRHPVLFNKLRYDGFWSNRPRDVPNLARYVGRELERPFNWQVVGSQKGWTDWMDCPVLYIAGHEPPKLEDVDYDNLRNFALAGGTIYLNSDGGSEAFTRFATELSKRLFPNYEIATIPQDHPLYSMVIPMPVRPPVRGVSNGARLLLIHTPGDPAFSWQQRADKSRADAFQLGLNLFVYASGKTDFRNRLTTPLLPAPSGAPTHTVPFARLRYAGNWDPEPAAIPRLSRYLWQQTGWALEQRQVDMAALTPETAPIAHLTGTAAHTPTPAEILALKSYVEAGGVLVIDNCGGNPPFATSVESSLLPRAFPQGLPAVVNGSHPLLNGKSDCSSDLGHARVRLGKTAAPSPVGVRIFKAGKGHVIYSPIDITSGLLGTSTAGITGFKFEYAEALMKNIILWTEDGQPE